MTDAYPTLDSEDKTQPLLVGPQEIPPNGAHPFGQPPTGFQTPGPAGFPAQPAFPPQPGASANPMPQPGGYQNPPPLQPMSGQQNIAAPTDDLDTPFKIKGLVELQREFNSEEAKIVRKQPHILSLLLNLLVMASRTFIGVVLIGSSVNYYAWRRETVFLQGNWGFFLIPEALYLIEYFCSSTLRYLWNKTGAESIKDYVVSMKNTRPSISMWCECYHFETRIRYVTEHYTVQGPNGPESRTRQRVETYQEKVVTYTETDKFDFSHFYEISRMISDDIYNNDLIKIRFGQRIEFGDAYTRAAYDRQLGAFIARNKHRDTCFSYTENKSLPGFKERMFSVNGESHSCFMTWFWFTVATIAGLTWPFRIWVEAKCVRGEFNFHSLVFRDPRRFGY